MTLTGTSSCEDCDGAMTYDCCDVAGENEQAMK